MNESLDFLIKEIKSLEYGKGLAPWVNICGVWLQVAAIKHKAETVCVYGYTEEGKFTKLLAPIPWGTALIQARPAVALKEDKQVRSECDFVF